MDPIKQPDDELPWTAVEKKAARKAFDKAFERHCRAITAEVKRMLENSIVPADIWRVPLQLFGFAFCVLNTHAGWMVDGRGLVRPTPRKN